MSSFEWFKSISGQCQAVLPAVKCVGVKFACHMHLPPDFVKKPQPQQGVAATMLRKTGGIMPYIMPRGAFGK